MPRRTTEIRFPGTDGHALAARLDFPDGAPRAFALFAHCFTCSKDFVASARLSRALAERGYGVLRFDFTGLGGSEGEFANTTFSSNVGDLVAAAAWLREHHQAPALLVGHSLGGAAVLAAAGRIPEARAIATIGAPADPAHVEHHFCEARPEIEARGEAEVTLGGRPFTIRKEFLDDIAGQKLEEQIRTLGRALLVMHAPGDATVDIDNARRIYQAARHPKSFISLDDADHLLTHRRDADYAAEVLAAWAGRYVSDANAPPAQAGKPALQGAAGASVDREHAAVHVVENGSRHAQTITCGPHTIRADEPPQFGGGDTAPTPYELLLTALGACSSITVRMYADRKGWPLEGVELKVRHGRQAADDPDRGPTGDRIDRTLTLTGDLTEEQRQRLLHIADRCPVHRMLSEGTPIKTALVT